MGKFLPAVDHSIGQSSVAVTVITNMTCTPFSLLEEVVDFNPMTAPPPVITEEITHSLEEMIRQRILDQVSLMS